MDKPDIANFKTIIPESKTHYIMSIHQSKVNLSKAVYKKLTDSDNYDKPLYVNLLINYDDKQIIIKATDADNSEAFHVRMINHKAQPYISSRYLTNGIAKLMGWNAEIKSCSCYGKWYEDEKFILFDLKNNNL